MEASVLVFVLSADAPGDGRNEGAGQLSNGDG
jgi:hypothetical protein